MKRFLFWLLVIGIVCFGAHNVQASPKEAEPAGETAAEESAEAIAREQAEGLELDRVGEFWNNILTEYGGHLPESQKGSLLEFVKGEKHFSPEEWGKALFSYLFHEVLANGKLLGTLILLTIFCVLLQLLQNAFQQSTVSKVAYAIVYMVLIILALNSFRVAVTYANEAIQTMTSFILSLVPLLLALMATSGEPPQPHSFIRSFFFS